MLFNLLCAQLVSIAKGTLLFFRATSMHSKVSKRSVQYHLLDFNWLAQKPATRRLTSHWWSVNTSNIPLSSIDISAAPLRLNPPYAPTTRIFSTISQINSHFPKQHATLIPPPHGHRYHRRRSSPGRKCSPADTSRRSQWRRHGLLLHPTA